MIIAGVGHRSTDEFSGRRRLNSPSTDSGHAPEARRTAVDWKLEVVIVPVADVDRAKEFYADKLGFVVDTDHRAGDHFRIVQVTPPGSACSIVFGKGMG